MSFAISSSRTRGRAPLALFLVLAVLLLGPSLAHASVGTGGGLPYEGWLGTLRDSVTGPVAFTFAVIGVVAAGATLIFASGEMGMFMKTFIWLTLVISLIIGVNNIIANYFGRGAEIASAPTALVVDHKAV